MDTATPGISVKSLRSTLGGSAAPLIIDVRRAKAYDADEATISGALRRSPDATREWAAIMPRSRKIVTTCVHGHELSQGVAQVLLDAGFDASYLEGGITWTIRKFSR